LPCHYCPNNNDVYGSVILSKIRIYPNPAQDIINIQLGKAGNRIYKIAVIDLAGRIMLQKEVKAPSNVVIPISQLQSGIYLIRLTGDKIMTFKIVKQ
jgi:xyloglucan-specific exo-beta-1,4-glucanase